jgi:DNA-binding NtrC family response regulator
VDLYHRLSVFTVQVPALRELGDDKRQLLSHFANLYANQGGVQPFRLDEDATALWMSYPFPGNVRELRNIVIRLTTKHAGRLVDREQLVAELDYETGASGTPAGVDPGADFGGTVAWAKRILETRRSFDLDSDLRHWEKCFVEAALEITHGNLSQAAKLLGMHRTTLYSRMQSYGDNLDGATRGKIVQ